MKTIRLPFNDAMARAIVEGRKTVTRRPVMLPALVEPPGVREVRHDAWSPAELGGHGCFDNSGSPVAPFIALGHDRRGDVIGPPCAPGDLLIGRECWRVFGGVSDVRVDYRACGEPSIIGREYDNVGGALVHYLPDVSRLERSRGKWRPSIHMPDWAARIRRTVVSVTVERLQAITDDDAVQEGFKGQWHVDRLVIPSNAPPTPRDEFMAAWDSIYEPRGLGWDVNPWVWRIEFEGLK